MKTLVPSWSVFWYPKSRYKCHYRYQVYTTIMWKIKEGIYDHPKCYRKGKLKTEVELQSQSQMHQLAVGDLVLLKRMAFKGQHKIQDCQEDNIYCVDWQPYAALQVFRITPVARDGKVKVVSQILYLPFGHGNIVKLAQLLRNRFGAHRLYAQRIVSKHGSMHNTPKSQSATNHRSSQDYIKPCATSWIEIIWVQLLYMQHCK